ncbi:hypothetical protein LTR95_005699 [Oleoguttula sp. CCFEE 5521]
MSSTADTTLAIYDLQLAAFSNDPTCPAPSTDTVATGPSDYDEDQDLKRDLSTISKRDISILGGAAGSAMWAAVFNSDSHRANQLTTQFDSILGQTNLNSGEYLNAFSAYPENDPVVLVDQLLCQWKLARQNLRASQSAASSICVLPNITDSDGPRLSKRRLNAFSSFATLTRSAGSGRVNIGTIFDRILTSNVPLLYSRVIRYTYQPRGRRPRPPPLEQANIEIAFDLRQHEDLQEVTGRDIFFIVHAHVNRMRGITTDPTGLYAEIAFMHGYHGQYVYNANPAAPDDPTEYRVDFGTVRGEMAAEARNERAEIVNCDNGTVWIPGMPIPGVDIVDVPVAEFGYRMWTQGKSSTAFSAVL